MTTIQIIRDLTHATVFVRGENDTSTIALMHRDIKPDSPKIRRLVCGVERRARKAKT